MSSWKDPEIAGVRAMMAARQPVPGAPVPTMAERRAAMDAIGEAASLPAGCLHEPTTIGGVKCERIIPQGVLAGRTCCICTAVAMWPAAREAIGRWWPGWRRPRT